MRRKTDTSHGVRLRVLRVGPDDLQCEPQRPVTDPQSQPLAVPQSSPTNITTTYGSPQGRTGPAKNQAISGKRQNWVDQRCALSIDIVHLSKKKEFPPPTSGGPASGCPGHNKTKGHRVAHRHTSRGPES